MLDWNKSESGIIIILEKHPLKHLSSWIVGYINITYYYLTYDTIV